MSEFYKCEVFEHTDIVEVDGKSQRVIYNESGIFNGLFLFWMPQLREYVLAESDYRKVTEITKEEALEFIKDKRGLHD